MTFSLSAAACLICGASPRLILQHADCIASILWKVDDVFFRDLHYFHLPASQNRKPPDADAGNLPCHGDARRLGARRSHARNTRIDSMRPAKAAIPRYQGTSKKALNIGS